MPAKTNKSNSPIESKEEAPTGRIMSHIRGVIASIGRVSAKQLPKSHGRGVWDPCHHSLLSRFSDPTLVGWFWRRIRHIVLPVVMETDNHAIPRGNRFTRNEAVNASILAVNVDPHEFIAVRAKSGSMRRIDPVKIEKYRATARITRKFVNEYAVENGIDPDSLSREHIAYILTDGLTIDEQQLLKEDLAREIRMLNDEYEHLRRDKKHGH